MKQWVSLITLGVKDMKTARSFYEKLGWVATNSSNEFVTFFQMNGYALGLYGQEMLSKDIGLTTKPAPGGITLAMNVESPQEVDEAMEFVLSCGATISTPASKTDWGGYVGYFADPDGHIWEITYAPGIPLNDLGIDFS